LFVLGDDVSKVKRLRATGGISLLPGFDPFVLYPHSDRPVAPEHKERVYHKAAWVSATVVENGRVIAVWEQKQRGQRLELTVSPFGRWSRATQAAVASEAELLARYLGGRLDLRFA
jgi:hypothetical protein